MIFKLLRIRMSGQGMKICHHEITGEIFLHPHVIPDGPEIIPQMKETRGPYPAHDNCIFHGGKDNIRMVR